MFKGPHAGNTTVLRSLHKKKMNTSSLLFGLFLLAAVIVLLLAGVLETSAKKRKLMVNRRHLIKGQQKCYGSRNKALQMHIKHKYHVFVDCWRIRMAKKNLKDVLQFCRDNNNNNNNTETDCESTFALSSLLFLTPKETKERIAGFRENSDDDDEIIESETFPEEQISDEDNIVIPKEYNFETDSPLGFFPIQDQGKCSSCWAFALVAALEGNVRKASNILVKGTEQFLVSCYAGTCAANDPWSAYQKYIDYEGLPPIKAYPYVSGNGKVPRCKGLYDFTIRPQNPTWKMLRDDTDIQKHLLMYGPVITTVDSLSPCWQAYSSGVLTPENCKCDKKPNHAVVFIGWGVDKGIPYWLIRNSVGTKVGDKGYWRIKRGVSGDGMCGYRAYTMAINGSVAA